MFGQDTALLSCQAVYTSSDTSSRCKAHARQAEEDFICPKRECQNAEFGDSHMSAEPSAAKSRQAASDPPAAKPKNGVKPVKRKNADA